MNEASPDGTMSAQKKCSQCGTAQPTGALGGLCPACLLQQGVAGDTATQPPMPPFEPPTLSEVARLFPQLEIMEFIGKGGMGAVYKARQPSLDRFVALKILPAQTDSGPAFAERFNREARALARLGHPNIVGVYDFGQADGWHYFLMEFVDGVNLRQLQRSGRLSPREALQIVPQICDALQYAHDEGVVHRDIKPENVLVDRKGRVKIADFGLAKILGHDAPDRHLTGEGQVMGTPHYMAPEQVEHPLEVDHRADIYSLGVVFYEMLTGELPLGRFAPPSRKVRVDVRLDEVVLHALEKEPEQRYQHASQVKTAVETIAQTSAARPAPSAAESETGVPLFAHSFGLTFRSPLALKLARIGWVVGCLAALGFLPIPIPGWKGIFGLSGFFGLIGVAVLIEQLHRRRIDQSRRLSWWPQVLGAVVLLMIGIPVVVWVVSRHNSQDSQTSLSPAAELVPFMERTIHAIDAGLGSEALHLRTGVVSSSPADGAQSAVENRRRVTAWFKTNEMNLLLNDFQNRPMLLALKMQLSDFPQNDWNTATVRDVEAALLQPTSLAHPQKGELATNSYLLPQTSASPLTQAFRTDEGDIGVLQITDISDKPRTVKIRYKLAHALSISTNRDAKRSVVATFTEQWSPSLAPGEKPDPGKILEEANTLAAQGQFEEALRRHIWYHDHALEFNSAQAGVRLSFSLAAWVGLGRMYPKAMQALVAIRDGKTRELAEGRGSFELFHDVAAINGFLQDEDATFALFKTVMEKNPTLAKQCFIVTEDLLVKKGEYALCLSFIPDPEAKFANIRQSWENAQAFTRKNSKSVLPDHRKNFEDWFVAKTSQLIEILVGTGHKAEAENIREQALTLLDDPRLKSATSDAEKKVNK